jgi:hypothetical protein
VRFRRFVAWYNRHPSILPGRDAAPKTTWSIFRPDKCCFVRDERDERDVALFGTRGVLLCLGRDGAPNMQHT